MKPHLSLIVAFLFCASAFSAAPPATQKSRDALSAYFRAETAALAERCLADIKTLDDWNARRSEYRRQLAEMLGLHPEPPRTDLKPVITGKVDHPEFTVEKLHLQSRPGLYVTANLYIPKNLAAPAPAILYVCGHGNVKKNGVSYGSKTAYQHHGAWFARNGYVCLIPDTLQLGEIEGLHHGTYREKMWWWHSRGYTPAGVEAWNGIRCLDYLQSRPEVDGQRLGITGRSGGGAYSWWIAALDERIKVAVPVAGITDMANHVVDGVIEGHCDCMFMVNTQRWDFAQLAALIAPRPLLLSNSDKDSIFPLDGVQRIHAQVRRIYRLHKADDKLGLLITEGPHKDTQDLQVPAFRWFNRFLKNDDSPVEIVARKLFEPEQLRVFSEIPADQINTKIAESFVPPAPAPAVPRDKEQWARQRDAWMAGLRGQCFAAWPASPPPLDLKRVSSVERSGVRLEEYEFLSQENVQLRLFVARSSTPQRPDNVTLSVLDESAWARFLNTLVPSFSDQLAAYTPPPPASQRRDDPDLASFLKNPTGQVRVFVAPRGVGPSAWGFDDKKQTQILRRFALLGTTLDAMRVWDIRRAVQAVRSMDGLKDAPLWLTSDQESTSGLALYASLFEPDLAGLNLHDLPASHRSGPHFLGVMKVLDMPAACAMAAERCTVHLHELRPPQTWEYVFEVARKLNWPESRFRL